MKDIFEYISTAFIGSAFTLILSITSLIILTILIRNNNKRFKKLMDYYNNKGPRK